MAENSLRKLRRAAGYSSAKAFAEELGIPGPTYARYEQLEDGPDMSIPIKNAWAIADALCCSIDSIVGREKPSVEEARGNVQAAYNALSDAGKEKLMDYLGYLSYEDAQREERKRLREEAHWAQVARTLEDEFNAHSEDNLFAYVPPATRRARFEAYVLQRAQEAEVQDGATEEEQDRYAGEVMTRIMEAYDRVHPESRPGGRYEYAFVNLGK